MDGGSHIFPQVPTSSATTSSNYSHGSPSVSGPGVGHTPSFSETRHAPKKSTPLQVSVSANASATSPAPSPSPQASGSHVSVNTRTPKSPDSANSSSGASQISPLSPRYVRSAGMESPKSPRERLNDFLATEDPDRRPSIDSRPSDAASTLLSKSAAPAKAHSYSQLRNASSPLPDTMTTTSAHGHSSPPSPRSTATPPPSQPMIGSPLRLEGRVTPRNSSIDSAIHSISLSMGAHTSKGSLDSVSSSATTNTSPSLVSNAEVAQLVRATGSLEAAIAHLIRDKNQLESRNGQLWTLVEKQRKLILGLGQDLEAVRDEVRKQDKKLRHHEKSAKNSNDRQAGPPSLSTSRSEATITRPENASSEKALPPSSSGKSSISIGDVEEARPDSIVLKPEPLQIGGHSLGKDIASESRSHQPGDVFIRDLMVDEQNIRRPPSSSNHAHKQTSSSDLGVFSPLQALQDNLAPLRTQNLPSRVVPAAIDTTSQASPTNRIGMSPTTSFTAKRSQPSTNKAFSGPALMLTESTPPGNDLERMTPPRKAPPAPLDLGPTHRSPTGVTKTSQSQIEDHSGSEYEEDTVGQASTSPSEFDRGRKKTREDDDREREALLQQQEEERSRSKKQKSSKSRSTSKKLQEPDSTATSTQAMPMPPSIKALSPDVSSSLAQSGGQRIGPASLAGMLSPANGSNPSANPTERAVIAKPLLSPGIPLSPRPSDRPGNAPTPRAPREQGHPSVMSPPLSPNSGIIGLPLSPRAGPRQQASHLPQTPMSIPPSSPMPMPPNRRTDSASGQHQQVKSNSFSNMSPQQNQHEFDASGRSRQMSHTFKSNGIFKGFISEAYPNLLIPPNALPSIKIMVVSSRLKPSRNSIVLKGADEEPVFTLGVSARFDQRDLWQVEKPIMSLSMLDQQLRQSSRFDVKLPDRSLFSGHAPAKIDARRRGLENYFEAILDTQMDEKAAVVLCKYLSTNVMEPASSINGTDGLGAGHPASPTMPAWNGPILKDGYLTKRGKNFGGWKSRFFVLDEPVLRYYETPGGTLLGRITLRRAQIGKQSPPKSSGSGDESDSQYRHAFLIREPKKKDSNSFIDHVLCAENDDERDAWVEALMGYINTTEPETKVRPVLPEKKESTSSKISNTPKKSAPARESPDIDDFESLQAVPYEDTRVADPPLVRVVPDVRSDESPSPSSPASPTLEKVASYQSKAISGPQNGAKISDAGAWGNKPVSTPVNAQHPSLQQQPKKRGIFGFHNKEQVQTPTFHPNGSDLSVSQQQYQEQITNVRAAFGAQLADAVEFCSPRGVGDVCLPAVVYRCLQYLEAKNAAAEEGIFRMSGSNTLIKNLRSKFNNEGDFDMLASGQWYDVHAVASLLKQYLRDLPANILTRELLIQFLQVLECPDKSKQPTAYNVLVHRLPRPNYHLLRALCQYLIKVVNNSEVNKMDMRNIGIVFSPTLHIPTPVMLGFLTDFDAIFGSPVDAAAAAPALGRDITPALTADDIRSPRQQMFSSLPTPSYAQTSFANHGDNNAQINGHGHVERAGSTDIGFAPLRPSYDTVHQGDQSSLANNFVPGPEYAVTRPRNLAPGGSAKQSRRESSMLIMANGSGHGQGQGLGLQRKSSVPGGVGHEMMFDNDEFA